MENYTQADIQYDGDVLHNIIQPIKLNTMIINVLKFIQSSLNHGKNKTLIITEVLKKKSSQINKCITEETLTAFKTTETALNSQSLELMQSINTSIFNFYKNKNLVKYINISIYKNRKILGLPHKMVEDLIKTISKTSSRRTGSRGAVNLLSIADDANATTVDINKIFGTVIFIFRYLLSVESIFFLILGLNRSAILIPILKYVEKKLLGDSYEILNNKIKILFSDLKTESCLISKHDTEEFNTVIDLIKGVLNIKKYNPGKLYEIQIIYSSCLNILPFLISKLDITNFPTEIIVFNFKQNNFNFDPLINPSIQLENIEELFKIKFPHNGNTISIYAFNVALLFLYSIYDGIKEPHLRRRTTRRLQIERLASATTAPTTF